MSTKSSVFCRRVGAIDDSRGDWSVGGRDVRPVRRETRGYADGRCASRVHRQQERWVSSLPTITIDGARDLIIRGTYFCSAIWFSIDFCTHFSFVKISGVQNFTSQAAEISTTNGFCCPPAIMWFQYNLKWDFKWIDQPSVSFKWQSDNVFHQEENST